MGWVGQQNNRSSFFILPGLSTTARDIAHKAPFVLLLQGKANVLKILIIRFSSIGDIVLTSPVIRCVKQQLPDVELHILTKKAYSGLFQNNPYVHKVHLLHNSLPETLKLLKAEKFDHLVDLHMNLRSLRVKLALGVKSTGFPKLNLKKYLLVRFKWDMMPRIHIVDRYFEAVKPLGVVNDGFGLDYFVGNNKTIENEMLAEKFQRDFYAVVIGGNYFTKLLPSEKVREVINLLDRRVVLVGGKEDAERGEAIAEGFGEKVWNACGKLSLDQSARLVENSQAVLTNDTGMMHIAAAFKKPIVSVWGNTVPELGMYPYLPQNPDRMVIVEVKNLSCRPCSKIGFSACPKGHFNCMNKLEASYIANALMQISVEEQST